MRKDTALSFRVPRRLKTDLEKVALSEGRSLSQVCEALLAGGLDVYKKEGPKYLQGYSPTRKGTPPSSSDSAEPGTNCRNGLQMHRDFL